LPYGYVGAVLINSGDRSSAQIALTLMKSFYAATRGEPIARAHHAMTPSAYQAFVSELDESAHSIDWVDFYNVGSQVFVNVIVRPAGRGGKNYVRHGLSAAQYQQEYETQVTRGRRRLALVDSYLDNGQVRYAFIMEPATARTCRLSRRRCRGAQEALRPLHRPRLRATSVSVVSIDGERRFSTSWAAGRVNGLMVRSTVDGKEYQALASDMAGKMSLVYLNTYVHQGEVQYSAVFVGGGARQQIWRHGMSADAYQKEFDEHTGKASAEARDRRRDPQQPGLCRGVGAMRR
jgi:hypothetical protein